MWYSQYLLSASNLMPKCMQFCGKMRIVQSLFFLKTFTVLPIFYCVFRIYCNVNQVTFEKNVIVLIAPFKCKTFSTIHLQQMLVNN